MSEYDAVRSDAATVNAKMEPLYRPFKGSQIGSLSFFNLSVIVRASSPSKDWCTGFQEFWNKLKPESQKVIRANVDAVVLVGAGIAKERHLFIFDLVDGMIMNPLVDSNGPGHRIVSLSTQAITTLAKGLQERIGDDIPTVDTIAQLVADILTGKEHPVR